MQLNAPRLINCYPKHRRQNIQLGYPPLTLAPWPPEGAAKKIVGTPLTLARPVLGANPLKLAGMPPNYMCYGSSGGDLEYTISMH